LGALSRPERSKAFLQGFADEFFLAADELGDGHESAHRRPAPGEESDDRKFANR
jgi:hypothetical protein